MARPISNIIAVTANSPAVAIPFPAPRHPNERVTLTVYSSAGVVEVVSDASQTKGLTVPTTSAGDTNTLAGSYRLAEVQDGELRVYAASPTAVEFIIAYEAE